jgi:DNA-directed RNA polymerase
VLDYQDTSALETLDNPLFERQLALEAEMRTAGIQRYRAAVDKANAKGSSSTTKIGTRLVVSSHEHMVAAVTAFIADAESGRAGRKHTAYAFVKKLDADSVANITARCALDTLTVRPSLTKLAVQIGGQIENEVNSRIFEAEMPRAWSKYVVRANEESLEHRKWGWLLKPAELLGVQLEEWSQQDKLLIGSKLLELFCQATGLFQVRLVKGERTGTQYVVEPTATTLAWAAEENRRLETMFPVAMPMVVPPKPWTSPSDGGYWSVQNHNFTLVKTRNKSYHTELASRDLSAVYRAVNALQETAWVVNTRVLGVMQDFYEAGSEVGDIPSAEPKPLPQRPHWMPEGTRVERAAMSDDQLEQFLRWKSEAHETYRLNAKAISKRAAYLRTVAVATKFKDEEAIFFPHQLDWRGRAYPMPLYLQPQGNDIQRGLLLFADGLPIADQMDADWLAIHGAGLFGVDKVSLEERVQWVYDNQADILASAADPYDNRFWTKTKKPWQFLAFCFEWAEFQEQGYGYLSRLPVQMDGTCNGLQNFSAMLLDEVGGAAVNLTPAEFPQDIYKQVAEVVARWVEDDLNSDDPDRRLYAQGWAGNVTRDTCKRPVMTLAYGAKRFGFVNQVEDDTLKPWKEDRPESYPFIKPGTDGRPFDYGFRAAMYLGGLIWEAVAQVVIAARAAMDWLQAAASIVSKQNLPINWTTPTGFLVQQAYRVSHMKDVATTFNNTRIRIKFENGKAKSKIDSRKQASGISPNWVHSLDASHLMLTIGAAADEGITAFSMIHDSYGTHAANAGALARILREQFVHMYSDNDVLAQFKAALEEQLQAELPPLPNKGNLDLNGVLESAFFFA